MKFTTLLYSLLLGATALALPAGAPSGCLCKKPMVRKEWRTLKTQQKINYLDAVKCLMHTPGLKPGAVTRYEDFLIEHQQMTPIVHFTGMFLPWHRLLLHEIERALRDECGYRGAVPYWDMRRDAADFLASPLLNGPVSFGGNGAPNPDELPPYNTTAGGDIGDGWFAGEIIHVGTGNSTTPAERRIRRNLSQHYAGIWFAPEQEESLLGERDFNTFSIVLETRLQLDPVAFAEDWGLHSGGHRAIGGDMVDPWSSPSDPLFYLHHANLDRVWARWQAADPRSRQFQVGGPIAPRTPMLGPWPYPPPAGNVTLDSVLDLSSVGGGDAARVLVAQIMDIAGTMPHGDDEKAGVLCYRYDQLA